MPSQLLQMAKVRLRAKLKALRVQQACHVMQAFNLFGLREHIPAILSQPMVVAAFGKRLKMGLNGADKVLSIFQILQCPS